MSSYTDKTYIVFLDLPQEIVLKLDKIRSKYSSSYKKYPAHITLKQDEDFLISSDEICQIVEDQTKNQKAFKIKLKNPEVAWNKIGWNIHLPVESSDLNKIVKQVSLALEKYIDLNSPRALLSTKWEQSGDFYIHISIKGGGLEIDPTDLLARIQKENFDLDFSKKIICDTITVANWKTDKWQKIKSFKLQNV